MHALGLAWGAAARRPQIIIETYAPRAAPVHHGARLLLENWREGLVRGGLCVGRDVPSRALARILSSLALYEPLRSGDFRVRLAGHGIRRRFGHDVTGENLSCLLEAGTFAQHAGQMQALLETGEPLVGEVRLTEDGRLRLCYEQVALRVLAPDGRTHWVLSGIFFHDWRL